MMRAATAVLGLLYVTSISTAAPQNRFNLVKSVSLKFCLHHSGLQRSIAFFQGDMLNGIADAVTGNSRYDSPPYEVIATHGEVSISFSNQVNRCPLVGALGLQAG